MRPRPRRHLSGAILLAAVAGTVTGLAAAAGVGPFSGLPGRALAVDVSTGPLATRPPLPVRADQLYPPAAAPTPREETVYVQDPAPAPVYVVEPAGQPGGILPAPAAGLQTGSTPGSPEATAPPEPTPAPTATAAPTAPPCDDDCGRQPAPSASASPSPAPGWDS